MAASDIITLGIGPGGDIETFLTSGLELASAAAVVNSGPGVGRVASRQLLEQQRFQDMFLPKASERVTVPFAIAKPPLLILGRAFVLTVPALGVGLPPYSVIMPSSHDEVAEVFSKGIGARRYNQEVGMARLEQTAEEWAVRGDRRLMMAYLNWKRRGKPKGEPTLREIAQQMAADGDPSILRAMRRLQ